MNRSRLLLALVVTAAVCRVALGVVEIEVTEGGSTTATTQAADTPISVNIASTTANSRIVIRSTAPTTETIGRITITAATGSNPIEVLVAGPGATFSTILQPVACLHWRGIESSSRRIRLVASIAGDLLDSVSVSQLYRTDIGGSALAPIISGIDSSDVGSPCFIVAGQFSASADIEVRAGSVSLIEAVGDLLANISVSEGGITRIEIGGDIGTPTNPVAVTAVSGVTQLVRADNFYGSFGGPTAQDSPSVIAFETVGAQGDVVGTIRVKNFDPSPSSAGIYIEGDLDGSILLAQDLFVPIEIGGSVLEGSRIEVPLLLRTSTTSTPQLKGRINIGGAMQGVIDIGQSLDGEITISQSQGLSGRIFINSTDNTPPAPPGGSKWLKPVTVGSVVLDQQPDPTYDSTAASLGGGTVGFVRFHLHDTDCTPAIGECVSRASLPTEIRLRHYGPVEWDEEDGVPFTVERRAIGSSDAWDDQTDCFAQQIDGTNDTIVVLSAPGPCEEPDPENPINCGSALQAGFEYRVTLNARPSDSEFVLRCKGIVGTPEVVPHTNQFIFSVGAASPGDANGDGVVNFNDTSMIMANWLADGCLISGDATRNGTVDNNDLTSVNANWLNSYDDCSSSFLFGGGDCERTWEDAIEAMAFDNAQQFAEFLAGLDEDNQELILDAVDEWLACER